MDIHSLTTLLGAPVHHADTGQNLQLICTSNIRKRKKCDLGYFDRGMLVAARWASWRIFRKC